MEFERSQYSGNVIFKTFLGFWRYPKCRIFDVLPVFIPNIIVFILEIFISFQAIMFKILVIKQFVQNIFPVEVVQTI
jgi:hypothetical protein